MFSAKSIGRLLKKHIDEPVRCGKRTLVLRRVLDSHSNVFVYEVVTLKEDE